MVKLTIKKKNNRITYFEIKGHANAGKYGEDIVCSAVSVLGQTAIIGLLEVAKVEVQYQIRSGYITCEIPDIATKEKIDQMNSIMETIYLGFVNVKRSYSDFLEIDELEV